MLDIIGRAELGRLPTYIVQLEQQNLVKRTDTDEYVLVRNLAQVDFWSFFSALPYTLPLGKDIAHIYSEELWMQTLGPELKQCDDYLAQKLSIPLASIFERS